jgi:outer membrane protein W
VPNVEVDSYLLRGLWQFHFVPDGPVTPYVGLGLGLAINAVDDDKVDAAKGFDARDAVGAGLDGTFMLGVAARVPRAEYISVFAEGRLGLAFDAAGRGSADGVSVEDVGGASGSAGLRFRF